MRIATLGSRVEERGYAYFEHTADVGIRAWGSTLEEAFSQAARGLVANMLDLDKARESNQERIVVEADSLERLLYQFLDELLYWTQTNLFVVARADVRLEGDTRLRATLHGEAYDAARHGHIHEIKAITFHDLEIRRAPPEVRVIVDI